MATNRFKHGEILQEHKSGFENTKCEPFKLMKNINLPILSKPILIAGLIVFIDISKELPLTLIIRPFNFDTLATLTYDLVNQAQFYSQQYLSF